MSEQQTAAGTPAATATSTQTTTAVTQTAVTQQSEQEPSWLPDRLKRAEESARKSLLAELGVTDTKDVKAALKAAKDAEDAKKTETEKLLGRIGELEPAAKRAADLEAVVKAQADAALASLTDVQRAAVAALGGEDPAQQLRAIAALRPTWTAAPQGAPPPANNAPPANQPKPAASKTKFDEWSEIKNDPRRQVAADFFYNAHRFEIERTRPA